MKHFDLEQLHSQSGASLSFMITIVDCVHASVFFVCFGSLEARSFIYDIQYD
jgi:hypothetical protein